jgi:hypothetical protein
MQRHAGSGRACIPARIGAPVAVHWGYRRTFITSDRPREAGNPVQVLLGRAGYRFLAGHRRTVSYAS